MNSFVPMAFALGCMLCVGCRSPEHPQTSPQYRSAADGDILLFAKDHPAGYSYQDRPIEYGDPNMEEAVKVLADIPRPWTVQKLIPIYLRQRDAYVKQLNLWRAKDIDTMWAESEHQSRRGGCLATALAASRDPRAAAVLGRSLEMEECPDGDKVCEGLFDYFLEDPRYKPVRRYAPGGEAYTNFLPIMEERARIWWSRNKRQVLADARAATAAQY